jgi:phage shock protein A
MQVKRNVVNINYHVAEYKQIVESLRAQVSALKTKVQQMEREKQELLGTPAALPTFSPSLTLMVNTKKKTKQNKTD